MRLIVTRPSEDGEVLKAKLESLGHEVVLSPLLHIVPLEAVAIPEASYQLIALTSANAIRVLASHKGLARYRATPVYTVGPQSEAAARGAGFATVRAEGGDAAGLAAHLATACDPKRGPVLYLSGRDSASNFSGQLERAGFTVHRIIAYEARPAAALAPGVHDGADAVLLYSPRTARIWTDLMMSERLQQRLSSIIHVCLSHNVAAQLPETHDKRIAAEPTEAAMLDLISGLSKHGGLA